MPGSIPSAMKEIIEYVGPELAEHLSAAVDWSAGVALEELAVLAAKKSWQWTRSVRQTDVLLPVVEQEGSLTAVLEHMRDEDVADLIVGALDSATRTSLRSKRIAMGLVISARLAGDDADVDEAPLLLRALQSVDRPDVAVLASIRAVQGDASLATEPDYLDMASDDEKRRRAEISKIVADAHPLVLSTLVASGLVEEMVFPSRTGITGLSPFGRRFLNHLDEADEFDFDVQKGNSISRSSG